MMFGTGSGARFVYEVVTIAGNGGPLLGTAGTGSFG